VVIYTPVNDYTCNLRTAIAYPVKKILSGVESYKYRREGQGYGSLLIFAGEAGCEAPVLKAPNHAAHLKYKKNLAITILYAIVNAL
jgi:hypothetical protein